MVKLIFQSNKLLLLISFSILSTSFCSVDKVGVKLLEASSENWTSGMKGGGSGTEYYFKIKILTSEKVVFDSLWINGNSFKTYIANTNKSVSNSPIVFVKNDIITVKVSDIRRPNKPSNNTRNPPKKYKGAALLRYYVKEKSSYIVINSIVSKGNMKRP